jgi:V/A-type H+-transporting ATPase subunit D
MRNLAPTKTNLRKLREELGFARLGHELLDQKRNILVIELLTIVDRAVEFQAKVEAALATAFGSLEEAILAMGGSGLELLSSGINLEGRISLRQRRVMGTPLPVVDTRFSGCPPYYSSVDSSGRADAAAAEFRAVLELLGKLAELKVSIMRLATELRKTMRKVNALEKIAIPDLLASVRFVEGRIEENERDMFILMKMVKSRISAPAEGEASG